MVLATSLTAPNALAVNATDVYWTQDLGGAVGATLLKVPIAGGATTTLSTGVNGYALALDGTSVYWDQGLPLLSMPLGGGAATTLIASFQGTSAGPIWVAAGAVWGTQGNTGVWSIPVDGGTQSNTFQQPYGTASCVVDATSIYWLQLDTPAVIMKAPLAGGTPITLVAPDADGGANEQVGDTVYQNLAVGGTQLYWGEHHRPHVARRGEERGHARRTRDGPHLRPVLGRDRRDERLLVRWGSQRAHEDAGERRRVHHAGVGGFGRFGSAGRGESHHDRRRDQRVLVRLDQAVQGREVADRLSSDVRRVGVTTASARSTPTAAVRSPDRSRRAGHRRRPRS